MTKNFSDARTTLLNACDGYIQHNQGVVDGFRAIGHYLPASAFFDTVIDKYEPDYGFNDWVCCHYYYLLGCILRSFNNTTSPFDYFSGRYDYPFEEIKWWDSHGYSNDDKVKFDQTAPEIVLHNLTALFNVLNFHMERGIPLLAQKKIEHNYQENDLTALKGAPLSIQIHKTLENLKLRANFAQSIIGENCRIFELCRTLEKATPNFEGYLKGIAVRELKATLENATLNDESAVKKVEEQLKNGVTVELLKKNRQSQREKDLKFLSVISIFIGIGIFTTLGLVCKRLYDSGGRSINFFQPLSQNLYDTIESVTSDLEEDYGQSHTPI